MSCNIVLFLPIYLVTLKYLVTWGQGWMYFHEVGKTPSRKDWLSNCINSYWKISSCLLIFSFKNVCFSLVVWFMGHGDKSYLRIKDRDIHRRTEFIQPFADIEWLRKKPKLFFIQACANRRQSKRTPSSNELRKEFRFHLLEYFQC